MKDKRVYKIVITAIFIALCFVGTMIQIPLPSGGMIHLGNFFCILAALLCGGLIGGIAGGVGCGLYDLIIYSSVRGFFTYLVLKFIMGFFVGFLFRLIVNKNKKIKYNAALYTIAAIIIIFTSLTIVGFNSNKINLSSSIKNKEMYIAIVCTVGYLFSAALIALAIFSAKLKKQQKCVLFVCSLSVLINIFLEFVSKVILGLAIDRLNIDGALLRGFSSLPACILTGTITVAFISIIYPRLYNATKSINYLNDIDEEKLNNEE